MDAATADPYSIVVTNDRSFHLGRRVALKLRLELARHHRDAPPPTRDEAIAQDLSDYRVVLPGVLTALDRFLSMDETATPESISNKLLELKDYLLSESRDEKKSQALRRGYEYLASGLHYRIPKLAEALEKAADPTTCPCLEDLRGLFAAVARAVANAYAGFAPAARLEELRIGLSSRLSDVDCGSGPPLSGTCDVRRQPRSAKITLSFQDRAFGWEEFCQLPYVIQHELACHAWQGIGDSNRENSAEDCFWSEGWMDLAALQLFKRIGRADREFADALTTLIGTDFEVLGDAAGRSQKRRFCGRPDNMSTGGSGSGSLSNLITSGRQSARAALDDLIKAWKELGDAEDEAQERFCRFALRVNLVPMPRETRRRLGLRLSNELRLGQCQTNRDVIAGACREIVEAVQDAEVVEAVRGFLCRLKIDPSGVGTVRHLG